MTKDEILLRSRLEGKGYLDERENLCSLRAMALAKCVGSLLCWLLLGVFLFIDVPKLVKGVVFLILLGMEATECLTKAIMIRKHWLRVCAALVLVVFLTVGTALILALL